MVTERSICLDGKTCTAVISDEPEALLAAKAAGRAVVGVESERTGIWELKGIPGASVEYMQNRQAAYTGADRG